MATSKHSQFSGLPQPMALPALLFSPLLYKHGNFHLLMLAFIWLGVLYLGL